MADEQEVDSGAPAPPRHVSPFYPTQPVPTELFVGRRAEIDQILTRGVDQVASGKPIQIYIEGEYGIGKSSIAKLILMLAESRANLHGIYVNLGGAQSLKDATDSIAQATLTSGAYDPKKHEIIRNWLAKYVGEQKLFGLKVDLRALHQDVPNLSSPFGVLEFLRAAYDRLEVKGLVLVLDEIDGIASQAEFAHFLKGLVETNAQSLNPLPLLLILCGVAECRQKMLSNYEAVARIFDVVSIDLLSDSEVSTCLTRGFDQASIPLKKTALSILVDHCTGLPKIMHIIGDVGYWRNIDGQIDDDEAFAIVVEAADVVGKKFVEQQVYQALKSKDYRAILKRFGQMPAFQRTFNKRELAKGLSEAQKGKLDNFLQRMIRLKVIRHGDAPGEYAFNVLMARVYIWLSEFEPKNGKA